MKSRKAPAIDSRLDPGLFILRTGLGLCMLLTHGMPYLRSFEESAPGFNDPFGLGSAMTLGLVIAVEVGASLLLVLGYKSRLAALALAVTMAVAFFHVHGAEFSGEQSGELAFLYLLGFITLSITGPGRLSVDGR